MLAIALVRDFPQYYGYFHADRLMLGKQHIGPGVKFVEMYAPYAEGLKTGFICASGFNIVGSASRDGRRLIAVALGFRRADLRDEFLVRLFDQAFALKTAGSRPKVWQLRNEAGTPGNVLPQGECGMIRYDMPGDAAWLGTYGDWRTARRVFDTGQARARDARRDADRQGVHPARHGQQGDPAGRDHRRPRRPMQRKSSAPPTRRRRCSARSRNRTDFAPPFSVASGADLGQLRAFVRYRAP